MLYRRCPLLRWAFVLPTLLVGCVVQRAGNAFEPLRYPEERWWVASAEVEIHDVRRDVVRRQDFSVPTITWPGMNAQAAIALAPESCLWLQQRVNRMVGAGRGRLRLRVLLTHAYVGWRSDSMYEHAFARVEVTVQVEAEGGPIIARSNGTAWAGIKAVDVQDGDPGELFDRALVRAFEEAILQPALSSMVNHAVLPTVLAAK